MGNGAAFDTFIIGVRANTDTSRIKKATVHEINPEEGWYCSQYKGGRAKLGNKKFRPWWRYGVCLCKGKVHKSPPENQLETIDDKGYPMEELEWDPTCPLAAKQFINQYAIVEDRNYPKWSEAKGWFGKSNVGDIAKLANEWMELQGAGVEGGYSHNSGRKSLARWSDHLGAALTNPRSPRAATRSGRSRETRMKSHRRCGALPSGLEGDASASSSTNST